MFDVFLLWTAPQGEIQVRLYEMPCYLYDIISYSCCITRRCLLYDTRMINDSLPSRYHSFIVAAFLLHHSKRLRPMSRVYLKYRLPQQAQIMTRQLVVLRRQHGLKKLVPETCTCVGQSGTSFFWYKFRAPNRTQLYSSTETVRHVTLTMQHDWPASCCWARNCDELVSNFSCKFLLQVSWACVDGISLLHASKTENYW